MPPKLNKKQNKKWKNSKNNTITIDIQYNSHNKKPIFRSRQDLCDTFYRNVSCANSLLGRCLYSHQRPDDFTKPILCYIYIKRKLDTVRCSDWGTINVERSVKCYTKDGLR